MKYEENDYQSGSGAWLLFFVLGGLIGAAIGLLMAPKPGRQTREQIKDIAQDAKEQIKDIAQDAKEKAEGYYDQARSKISTAMQKGAEVLHHKKGGGEPTGGTEEG